MASQSEEPIESNESTGALGEISHGPGAFESFLDQHHKKILIFGILIAIGGAGHVVKQGIDEGRENAAGNALYQAKDAPSLQDILKNHANTQAAGSASILLAENQWKDGQQDAAIETLRNFINNQSSHPAKPTALASLASKLTSQGKTGDAADVFRSLVDDRSPGNYLAAFALIGLGDLAQSSGNLDEAEASYRRVREEFATSPFSDAASRRIQFLHAALPVEVDPPAPEPEATPSDASSIENDGEIPDEAKVPDHEEATDTETSESSQNSSGANPTSDAE